MSGMNVQPSSMPIFAIGVIVFLLVHEVGFRVGRWWRGRVNPEQRDHVSIVLGGLLGVLGLMLAFAFGMSETRFQARRELVVDEANAIGTTYLRAAYLPEPQSSEIRAELKEYTDILLQAPHAKDLRPLLAREQALHASMWQHALEVERARPDSPTVAIFLTSLNETIDLFETRLVTVFAYRIPTIIVATLYAVALLAMGLIGYGAGLAAARNLLSTAMMVTAIAAVLYLIIDLDRPGQRLFKVAQRAMQDTRQSMEPSAQAPPEPVRETA